METLTASEALYGFVGWLTTRTEGTIMSSRHDASKPACLVAEFCKANNLAEPRENWTDYLTTPPTYTHSEEGAD